MFTSGLLVGRGSRKRRPGGERCGDDVRERGTGHGPGGQRLQGRELFEPGGVARGEGGGRSSGEPGEEAGQHWRRRDGCFAEKDRICRTCGTTSGVAELNVDGVFARSVRQGPGNEWFPELPCQVIEVGFVADANLDGLPNKVGALSFRVDRLVGQRNGNLRAIGADGSVIDKDGDDVGVYTKGQDIIVASIVVGSGADADLPKGRTKDVVANDLFFQKKGHAVLDCPCPHALADDGLPAVLGPGGILELRDTLSGRGAVGADMHVVHVGEPVGCQIVSVALGRKGQPSREGIRGHPLIQANLVHPGQPDRNRVRFLCADRQGGCDEAGD